MPQPQPRRRSRRSSKFASPTTAVAAVAPLVLNEKKTTQSMRTSLKHLHSCLCCPLCHSTFVHPVTLPACAHSFCQTCISDYACNNYDCPVCRLPITLRGTREGKFDKTNPQMNTVVSSFHTICTALNAAPNAWWKEETPLPTTTAAVVQDQDQSMIVQHSDERYEFSMPREDYEDDNDNDENDTNKENDFEEEVMDNSKEDAEEEIMEFRPLKETTNHDVLGKNDIKTVIVHHDNEVEDDDDDEATALFPVEPTSPASVVSRRRSCSLPSQSPECSMIAPISSQLSLPTSTPIASQEKNQDTSTTATKTDEKENDMMIMEEDTSCHKSTSTNATTPRTGAGNKDDKVIRIHVATNLSSDAERCLNKLEHEGHVQRMDSTIFDMMHDNHHDRNANPNRKDIVVLCDNAEMETGDGWLVGISYGYLWAVACGANLMLASSYVKHFSSLTEKDRIIGVGGRSTEWMGPQRAMKAQEQLFKNHTVLLMGDFDIVPKRGADVHTVLSKERLHTLLCLSGAKVVTTMEELQSHVDTKNIGTCAILIRPNPHPRDWRAARKATQNRSIAVKDVPIISADWLVDCLADYRCKDVIHYTQTNFKR